MSKNLFQDMVKINHAKKRENNNVTIKQQPVAREIEERQETEYNPSAPRSRHTLWFVAIIAVAFFVFALSYLFSKTEVVIDPKMKDIALNENLSANLKGGTGDLSFDLVVISGEETKMVKATEEREVSQKARGTVVIYNNYSSATQTLDIDTRLEGSNGKIYKTEKKIVVPGMIKSGTPGSIEVRIYAAEGGERYNSAPLDFTIFGFKGSPKYSKFYARSKGEITGGFKGKSHVVSGGDKMNALNELKDVLKEKLRRKAVEQIPSGFILFKDAVSLDIEDMEDVEFLSPSDTLPIKQKGTLYGILFEEKQLTKKIVGRAIEKYDGSEVYILDMEDLTFSLSQPVGLPNFSDLKNINFNLSGATKIVWKLDVDKLRADLLKVSKGDFNQVLLQYPNISSAKLSLSPIWKRSIPDKPEDIEILVNYPE
ncbi:hypothetical protein A3A95_00975 [Candidatus Nomurabacteria bacterium RIFCSPLOWO2_01_FULL_39_18]|uniref:Baseplate protein J-like domain-containing protein n=1 Tax=Candidatus Nomurabacteria bacterium RIFCSPHIGHO2_01_FULL_40_24b TaxID=1801739 RepID=A0A1F6V6Z4_9BACT|nr:MAG: hypothetical protein A2647_02775 [Candidatus Nomurabacteria bacterium RIFCSPHIGHO2_01_FULL_40_24b]OGI89880.1 MAG: hypothetical protein A3A95_00975 [Candidatus Nomurabacteria bacterium RIFCSPLOWO2_01_FULL_39_18]